MEPLDLLSVSWLRVIVTFFALTWLAYRAYQVLLKPADELISLLGLEVPSAAEVSLAGIKADGVLLHWKAPDRGAVSKYTIRINGIDVGETTPQETAVTVEGLRPEHFYIVRVVTSNTTSFHTASPPLRFRTLPSSSEQFYNSGAEKDTEASPNDEDAHPAPIVKPYKAFTASRVLPPTPPPPMAREHSGSQSRARRSDGGRRNSPGSSDQHAITTADHPETNQSIVALTEKLESLRREIDEAEKQIGEEDEDFETAKAEYETQRDEKKRLQKAHDDASKDLRRQMAQLTQENYAAQKRKEAQEKLLDQKQSQRMKMKRDIEHWTGEASRLTADLERITKDKASYKESSARALEEKHEHLHEQDIVLKETEMKIRSVGSQVQVLEEEKKKVESGEDQTKNFEATTWAEVDRLWAERTSELQRQYTLAWTACQQAESLCREAQRTLQHLQRRASQTHLFNSMVPMEFLPPRRNSQRRRRTGSIHNEQYPTSSPAGFVMSTAPPFNSSVPNISPTFASASPFFNINNGMSIPTSLASTGLSPIEIEALTGGAPMSPTAGGLLPSGLLGDETDRSAFGDSETERRHSSPVHEPPSMIPFSPPSLLPGLGAPQMLEQRSTFPNPSSPISIQSRPPSLFASPRASSIHLPAENVVPETTNDSDRKSVRSVSSSLRSPGQQTFSSRFFGGLMSMNRQRGKTMSDEGPVLGSLKGAQSQSLPRQDQSNLDPIGTQRRRGSYSGNWMDSMSSAFTKSPFARSSAAAESSPPQENAKHIATRRRAFNMFGGGSKTDPWNSPSASDRPSSPRPDSIRSFESSALPRPSTENQQRFGWPAHDSSNRNSLVGTDWPGLTAANPWSRHPSRRPSIQQGQAGTSSGSFAHEYLPFGSTDDLQLYVTKSPTQAPIGTRPQSSQSRNIPPTPPKQLNPAAPNFTSLFTRNKKMDKEESDKTIDKKAEKAQKAAERKAEKAEKAAERKAERAEKAERKNQERLARKEKEKDRAQPPDIITASTAADLSPTISRVSKEIRSASTTDTPSATASISSPRESLERTHSESGYTLSSSLASTATTTSTGKESFMQKLTRKSSSSKFNFSFSKNKNKLGLAPTSAGAEPSFEFGPPLITTGADEESDASFLGTPRTSEAGAISPYASSVGTPGGSNNAGTKGSTLGWTGLRRKNKKERERAPSVQESVTSEANTTEDEDGDIERAGLGANEA